MDEVRNEIIRLCKNLFGETKDEIKKNNKSVDSLINIFNHLSNRRNLAESIYSDLLNFDDDKVKFEAAVCCYKLNFNVKKAKKVMHSIAVNNDNPIISFSAEMVLESWNNK